MNTKIKPTHDLTTTTQPAATDKSRPLLKLGLDVDLQQITATVQSDHQQPKPAQSFTVARLVQWVREKVAAGHTVCTVYESCGFGYTLHYQLVAAVARNLVISPVRLHTERRRKNDRLDSRTLCLRLSRYLDGQKDELPTRAALTGMATSMCGCCWSRPSGGCCAINRCGTPAPSSPNA